MFHAFFLRPLWVSTSNVTIVDGVKIEITKASQECECSIIFMNVVKPGIGRITLLNILFFKLNKILPYLSIENCADRSASSLFYIICFDHS